MGQYLPRSLAADCSHIGGDASYVMEIRRLVNLTNIDRFEDFSIFKIFKKKK